MGKDLKTILFLILIYSSFSTIPVHAADSGLPVDDIGANMVKKGFDLFAYSIGDSMISLGTGNETVNREEAPDMIFKLLTFSVDPYKFSFVQEWQQVMVIFFVMLTLLMVMLGGASVLINRTSPDIAYRISWLLDSSAVFDLNKWVSTIFIAIIFLLLGTFGLYYLLQFEYVVSAIITEKALLTVPPTIDNIIAYLLFASVYLLLSVIMAIRSIIILLMAAGSLGLFALYLIPQTRQFAASAFMYFLVVLFMQPALLFIAAVGLAFVQMIPLPLLQFKVITVLGLTIFMAVFSLLCILGKGLVKNIIWIGSRAAI
jgi:hypothetical protein